MTINMTITAIVIVCVIVMVIVIFNSSLLSYAQKNQEEA